MMDAERLSFRICQRHATLLGPNRAYQRIIDAIVHIINREQSSEGMAIGLEGSWGGGKTTIISLLRNRISEGTDSSKETLPRVVATFDAWAHEGDPLRLAFIDNLTTTLIDAGWVDSEKWRERLEIVSRRRQVQDAFRDFRPTPLDFLNALLFFLIPIGVPLLNSALRTDITINIRQPLAWDLWLGLVCFLAAPILVFARLISRSSQSQNRGMRTTLADELDRKQSLFSLLLTRTLSNERTVVIKTPEPTSFEFEKHFSELMEDALGETNRKLVLVVDNLDRVHPEEAHRIWSTLQTFLQYRHYNPPPWLSRLFTIILYDPSRISTQPTAPMIAATIGGDEYGPQISAPINDEPSTQSSFLDKTIQVRFEVPPPILSDWHGYLLDLLGSALPDHDQTEHHLIYRILAVHMTRQKRLPTIRELKIYVNQICAIHLQWQDALPLTHMPTSFYCGGAVNLLF